jgi:hypothetical protein
MSETPRTDAVNEFGDLNDLCERLERELSAALARAEKAEAELAAHKRLNKDLESESVKVYAERDAALEKLARYETLRPYAVPTNGEPALYWGRHDGEWVNNPLFVPATHWTPLPDVKEAK